MSKQIYWVEVLERIPGTLDGKQVLKEYPFPGVPFAPFGFDLELFREQIGKIEEVNQRMATQTRFDFIVDRWHPKNFIRLVIKPWKYA